MKNLNLRLSTTLKNHLSLENGPAMDRQRLGNGPAKSITIFAVLLMLFVVGIGNAWATPTTIFSESFGSTSSTSAYGSYEGYSATTSMFTTGSAKSNYSGDGSVGKNDLAAANLSSGYTGASGLSGCYQQGVKNTTKTIIQISNIKITGYTDLHLSFGALGGSSSHTLNVYYKIDTGSKTSLISNGAITNASWTLVEEDIDDDGDNLTIWIEHTPSKGWMVRLDDIKITGTSSGSTYTVNYSNGGHGTAPSSTTASSVTLSAITGVNGYTCTGWTANQAVTVGGSSISAGTLIANGSTATLSTATTFTAQWSTNNYSITYHENGGTNPGTPATSYTIESSDITLPTPTKTGYTFAGWYANSDLSTGGVQTTIAAGSHENKEYWAKWTVNWKFMYNGDSYSEHTFNSSKQWTQSLNGNTTYYFRISDGGSTVYRLAGASTMTSANCTSWDFGKNYSTDCGIQTTAPGDYVFSLTDADPSTKVVVSVAYPSSVAITLNMNGHGGDNITWYAPTGGVIPTPANPSASGYVFGGWYTDAGCTEGNEWDFSTVVNSAQTLYAKWTQCYYYHDAWISDWAANEMTESADGTYWYYQTDKSADNRLFKIQRNSVWYGYQYNSPGFHCTDITNMNSSSNTWSVSDSRCAVNYNGNAKYYIIVYVPNTSINTTNNPIICASTFLPEASYDMAASRKIYFDNYTVEWSDLHYRIGHKCHTSATAMTLVPGTAGLYQVTTTTYGGYNAFHVANNAAWGGDYDIYAVRPGSYDISNCLMFQKYAIDGDITLTPGSINNTENSCNYWTVTKTSGMKSRNVAITAPSHGTITVTYTNTSGATGQTLTSGNADLAYTCNLTISAEGSSGYDFTSMTKNGAAYTPGALVLTEDITLAATFSAITYNITYNLNGGTNPVSPAPASTYTIESSTITLPTPTKDYYDFAGWYGNSDLSTGGVQTTIAAGSTGDKPYWAKWTPTEYNITYNNMEDATNPVANPATYTIETATITLQTPTKDGYEFGGWFTDDGVWESEVTTIALGSHGDVTLYAKWTAETYDVEWYVNEIKQTASGTYGSEEVTFGEKIAAVPATEPSVPLSCTGKTFVGWTNTPLLVASSKPSVLFRTAAAAPTVSASPANNTVKYYAVFADGSEYTDVINNAATAANLNDGSTSSYQSNFTITGSSTNAQYYIHSMGTGTGVALRWNSNGYLYTNTAPTSPINPCYVQSVTVTTTADKSIKIYYDYRNSAYQANTTFTATSSGATCYIDGDYDDIKIAGMASGTVISSLSITYANHSNYITTCATPYTITFNEIDGTDNGDAYAFADATSLSINTLPTASTGYEVDGYYAETSLTTRVADADGTLKNGSGSGIAGWTNSSGQFIGTADADLYIKWQAKTITVTWDVNGGTALVPGTSSYTYNGSTVALPTPTKAGYWFDGWYTLADGGVQITEIGTTNKPSSDVTYYAHWTSKTYTDYRTFCVEEYDITLHDNNGGSNNGSAKVTTNGTSLTTIVAPTRAGYEVDYYKAAADGVKVAEADGTLVGPVTDWTNSSHEYTKGDDATMYAHWKYAQYDIAYYDKNSAAFSGVHEEGYPTKHTYNTATTLDSPTRAGYTFEGWYTVADCSSGKVTSLGATAYTSGPINLYANWTQNNWTLTMASSVGGGAGTTASDAAITAPTTGAGTVSNKHYGDEITVTVSTPSHHTFTGWTSSNGGSFANASLTTTTFTMPDNATTVTANFTEDTKYTVTWYDNGDGSNTEQVYSGETTTFPDLATDCDMYKAAGWIAVSNPATEFTSETMDKPAATIYAAGATTSAITGNVTYKAVYRHKYYTNDAFVNGTTNGEAYYLYATYSGDKYYKCNSAPDLTTSTDKANAKPVYLEKVGGSYYIREVATDKYFYGNSGSLAVSDNKSATDAYKWTFSTPSCSPDTKGDYKIVNEADKASKTLLFNSGSGKYIKEYSNTNDCAANYYNFSLEKAYYYKYSPTAACYEITVSSNAFGRGDFETIDGSHKLQGNELTVTPHCGYAINSISITNGTYTATSNSLPTHDAVTYTIIPTGACTFTVNFTTENDAYKYTISFLDGSSTMEQTKTDAIKACDNVTLPNGYSTASGAGGACSGWTFDGWTQTEYTFGQLSAPSDIETASSEQTVSGDETWYAVYHKTFAAGDYFYLMYGANYVTSFNSSAHKFVANETTTTNALLFAMENNYLYYLDPSTRRKMWVYADGNTVDVTATETKPSSTAYQTTMTLVSGTYQITNGNNRYLSASGTDVKYYSHK